MAVEVNNAVSSHGNCSIKESQRAVQEAQICNWCEKNKGAGFVFGQHLPEMARLEIRGQLEQIQAF
jgi:hypothetical protein